MKLASVVPYQDASQIPDVEDIHEVPNQGIFTHASYEDEGAVADFTNLEFTVNIHLIPQSKIHSIHPTTQILKDPKLAVQTRSKVNKSSGAHAFVDAMQEELLQFKIQKYEKVGNICLETLSLESPKFVIEPDGLFLSQRLAAPVNDIGKALSITWSIVILGILHFDISFADALLYMPKFASTFKSLLSNKEKLFELASTPLNENCLAVLLKTLSKKLGDPDKFLILCDFPELDECLALADLGASINLMPLSVWKQLSLPELTSTGMTLELANRSTVIPTGVVEDVFVKVGNEKLTLRVNDEAITFKVRHTLRYSRNYYDETVYNVNVIDVACKEYAQEVLGYSDSLTSGNPTPSNPIIASFSPSFTSFEGGDFILEEIETFLHPSPNLPPMKNDDLKQVDVTMMKPSIEEPPELELKDLPSHLEYAFLEGTDKLPVIISKELKEE
ncbi:reverse transcriptase domain-containing protein [Tanacetum coccineum]